MVRRKTPVRKNPVRKNSFSPGRLKKLWKEIKQRLQYGWQGYKDGVGPSVNLVVHSKSGRAWQINIRPKKKGWIGSAKLRKLGKYPIEVLRKRKRKN